MGKVYVHIFPKKILELSLYSTSHRLHTTAIYIYRYLHSSIIHLALVTAWSQACCIISVKQAIYHIQNKGHIVPPLSLFRSLPFEILYWIIIISLHWYAMNRISVFVFDFCDVSTSQIRVSVYNSLWGLRKYLTAVWNGQAFSTMRKLHMTTVRACGGKLLYLLISFTNVIHLPHSTTS